MYNVGKNVSHMNPQGKDTSGMVQTHSWQPQVS